MIENSLIKISPCSKAVGVQILQCCKGRLNLSEILSSGTPNNNQARKNKTKNKWSFLGVGVGGFYICRWILILFSHCHPYSVNIFKNQFYMTVVENLSMDVDHHAQRKFNSFSDSRDCKVLVTSRLAAEGDLYLIYRH